MEEGSRGTREKMGTHFKQGWFISPKSQKEGCGSQRVIITWVGLTYMPLLTRTIVGSYVGAAVEIPHFTTVLAPVAPPPVQEVIPDPGFLLNNILRFYVYLGPI